MEETEGAAKSAAEAETGRNAPVFLGRNIAFARVWTNRREPVAPADLAAALAGRGFVPGISDPGNESAPLTAVGLAEQQFTVGGSALRVLSLSSSKGNGCLVSVDVTGPEDMPKHYLSARTVPKPRLVYVIEAGGPSNSDRALCENTAEALMELTDGLVEIGGRGAKSGNRPQVYHSRWLGEIRH